MSNLTKICPGCRELIDSQVEICGHCAYRLNPHGNSHTASGSKYWVMVAVLVLGTVLFGIVIELSGVSSPSDKPSYAPNYTPNSSPKQDKAEWYQGGTLHKATVQQWHAADYDNKLATASDFLTSTVGWDTLDEARVNSKLLVVCIDEAVEVAVRDGLALKANEMAVACIVILGWEDKNG